MMNEKLLYKILRYSAQAAIVYLLFRYFPGSKLNTTQSLVATLIILILSIIIERLCVSYLLKSEGDKNNGMLEKFDSASKCTGKCGVEKFEEPQAHPEAQAEPKPAPQAGNKKCRVVCDAVPEGFEDTKKEMAPQGSAEAIGDTGKAAAGTPDAPTGTAQAVVDNAQAAVDRAQDAVEQARAVEANARVPPARDLGYDSKMPPTVQPRELPPRRNVDEINRTGVIRNENGKVVARRPTVDDASQDSTVSASVNDDRFYWGTRYGNLGYDDRYGFGGMFYDEYPFYNRFRNTDHANLKNTGEYYTDRGSNDEYRKRREAAKVAYREGRMDDRARELDGYDGRFQEVGSKSERDRTTESRRRIEGPLEDEIPYSDYNHLPVAAGYKSHDYEYGYSFLPPEKWYNQPPRPPVCVSEKRCPVCPSYTTGTPMDVKEFHSARRITPPDLINTDYIGDKLNAGR